MEFSFEGEIIEWRGPAPYLFVPLPDDLAAAVADIARDVTYGWGCIPAECVSGRTTWTTSIFPRHGGYLVPVKVAVQRAEGYALGDIIELTVRIG
ncbi:DUF1905 domain-containing protein [Calidifontibacter sp. DB0510]|uniref:DUF1905 domain-containing protein n=1 Tax=Metallococcus carri TaxID=1656884 RepID=A0A967AZG4_9MICO|nr:DUF1905 domain-containing protein [Metallococcus carri]NOP36578.1 DUF1905 domain-containing protein [Calidifontibacter sp. DB2511S]